LVLLRNIPWLLLGRSPFTKAREKPLRRLCLIFGKGSFTPGQVYVALSRCTSLEGLVLKKPIQKHHMWMNIEVARFLSRLDSQKLESKVMHIEEAIKSQTSLTMIYRRADDQKVTITITPLRIGLMSYQGEDYLGLEGIFENSQEQNSQEQDKRVFRVDRIVTLVISSHVIPSHEPLA